MGCLGPPVPVEQQKFTVLHVSHPWTEGESEQRAPFCRERKIQVWEDRGMGAQLLVRELSLPDRRRNPKKVGTLTGITLGSGRGMLQLRAVSHGPVAPFRARPVCVPVQPQPRQEAPWSGLRWAHTPLSPASLERGCGASCRSPGCPPAP